MEEHAMGLEERARACRRALEQLVSPERLQELHSAAMDSGGVGLSKRSWSLRRSLLALLLALAAFSATSEVEEKAKRCLALMSFVVVMWAPWRDHVDVDIHDIDVLFYSFSNCFLYMSQYDICDIYL